MKYVVFCVLSLWVLSSCSKKANDFLTKDYKSLEGISIGMPINEALQILNKRYRVEKVKMLSMDGDPEVPEYQVYKQPSKKENLFNFNGGYLNKNKDKVFRIVIKNPKYKTVEGVSVGITVKQLKQIADLKSVDFNFQDGLFIMSGRFDGGYWIDIDKTKNYDFSYEKPSLKKIPDNLKIKGIVLF